MRLLLICLLLVSSSAHAQRFLDWRVDIADDGLPYTYTINASDGILGKWCNRESSTCFWMLLIKNKCDTDSEFPALINAQSGSVAVNLVCRGPRMLDKTTYYRLIFTEYDIVKRIVERDSNLGVAYATEGGAFQVSRFSLSGAALALTRMEALEAAWIRANRKASTKDLSL